MSESDPVTVAVQQIRPVESGAQLDSIHDQLSVDQVNVLEALMIGKSIKEAAICADVSRSTVYRWLATDPYFKAADNARKLEQRDSARARLSNLLDDAVNNVAKSLAAGDTKLSYQLLRDFGVTSRQNDGATDPGLVRQQIAADLQKQSPLSDPQSLCRYLTEAGLTRDEQRRFLIEALRPLRPKDVRTS